MTHIIICKVNVPIECCLYCLSYSRYGSTNRYLKKKYIVMSYVFSSQLLNFKTLCVIKEFQIIYVT